MDINVNTVYTTVLNILNKEQRGYVTPQEFNLFANQAQLDLFEQYFYDINQFGRTPGNDTEYSDMLDLLNKKIAIFGFCLMASCIPITANVELLKTTSLPILLLEATGNSLVMGNFNSDNTFRISEPTSPVQPTIAIFII